MGNVTPGTIPSNLSRVDPTRAIQQSGKVRFYSKDNLQGNTYEIEPGNYTSIEFANKISPDNVFSLTIPSLTTIKLFAGDLYDYGGKGSMQVTNVSQDRIKVELLPENIKGKVRSISITSHKDSSALVASVVDTSYMDSLVDLIGMQSKESDQGSDPIETFGLTTNTDMYVIWLTIGLALIGLALGIALSAHRVKRLIVCT
jgi:hypothetical protein